VQLLFEGNPDGKLLDVKSEAITITVTARQHG